MHKINIFQIVSAHIRTLHNSDSTRISVVDVLVFFGLPCLLPFLIWYSDINMEKGILSSILVVFSILFGFLLNVQVLIFSMSKKDLEAGLSDLIDEVLSNVSFCILLSLLCLIISVVMYFAEPLGCSYKALFSILAYLSGVLLLTVLMVFKRVHVTLIKA